MGIATSLKRHYVEMVSRQSPVVMVRERHPLNYAVEIEATAAILFALNLNIRVNLWHPYVSESTRCHAKAPNRAKQPLNPRNKG